jgi:hypothetical protein
VKHIIEENVEGGIEVWRRQGRRLSSYWIKLQKGEDTVN